MKTTIKLPSIVIDDKPYRVELKIELTADGNFSVCGGVWNRQRTDYVMCGQCLDELYPYLKNNSKFKQVYEWWKKWHLNDLHAGTEKQEQALEDFKTADGYKMDHAVFADEDFCEADDDSLGYRMIDEGLYGYLPRELIEKGTESEIRKYIVENIG